MRSPKRPQPWSIAIRDSVPLLWDGIITSEEAAMASLIHKLGLAVRARDLFEKAEAIGGPGPKGAVAMSLGVIYYRVPRFPMGFGDIDERHAVTSRPLWCSIQTDWMQTISTAIS